MQEQYTIAQYAADLRRITAATDDEGEIFDQVGPLAQRLAGEDNWIEERFFSPDPETGFSAFLLHEEDDHSLTVLAASWIPGMGVGPHDHGTWAVVVGVQGTERNIRYKRMDDRSQADDDGRGNSRVAVELLVRLRLQRPSDALVAGTHADLCCREPVGSRHR